MKQLLILSGKGGTGKTTVAGTFVELSQAKAVADCDVDAPNMHLILNQVNSPELFDYVGMGKALIDAEICLLCGLCQRNCAFEAIDFLPAEEGESGQYSVNEFGCEGCGVCVYVCPVNAVTIIPSVDGALELYRNGRVFSTATLKMGSGTTGKLVTEVKKNLMLAAPKEEFAVLDGSPGIGCPVIASISGVDMVLIVAEPSVSGLSDLHRIVATASRFQTPVALCINKYDTNEEKSEEIRTYCEEHGIPLVGKIPFDPKVVEVVNQGKTMAGQIGPAAKAIKDVYEKTMDVFWKN